MPRESLASKRERALEVAARMNEHYPDPECALSFWGDPFKLTVAVLLSAQTTDKSVNKVTPQLWERYPTVADLAAASQHEVEQVLRTIGLYRSKAKNCIACAQMVLTEHGGQVPRTMDELVRLPGVGRKTANIVLNEGFGIVEGIAVDTHVHRIAHLLKLSSKADPLAVEQDLLKIYPRELWRPVNHQWVLFGRDTCIARRPRCGECFLADICPSAGKPQAPKAAGKKTARASAARSRKAADATGGSNAKKKGAAR
ncbi:endonuclease III [Berryella wangjianweii]|uniref:Endonuclease III n=1 Tax=Berryella wangjianweii TaxID=2734634 RepID=A0A6M8J2C7_9ACTN|nr:endonuclease III [Berryella wangjianweii]NPD32172.1 endonuclease III [Eggerthellaceae bacterium zg-997]QKF07261.1 endonuclease III [Berryella wangjianweii]